MLSSLFNVFLAFSSLKFGTGESNLVLVSKIWYWPVKFGTGESNLVLVSKIWYYKEYLPSSLVALPLSVVAVLSLRKLVKQH